MQKPSRKLLAVGAAFCCLGACVLFGWEVVGWTGTSRSSLIEFPLAILEDVAVDAEGRIYVADGYHHRVQRYSSQGDFERGWFVDTAGVFALRTTSGGQVEVATARANKLLTYTADGLLLSDANGEDWYSDFAGERETTGPYMIRNGPVPRIVSEVTGQTVISTPWTKRLIAAPFPAIGYFFVGIALIGLGQWRQRRGRAR